MLGGPRTRCSVNRSYADQEETVRAMARTALWVIVCLIAAPWIGLASPASAEPLVPPTPAEMLYLDHLHQIMPGSGDPAASHGDGWFLEKGRYACSKKAQGYVGATAILLSPIITQIAYADLCPS